MSSKVKVGHSSYRFFSYKKSSLAADTLKCFPETQTQTQTTKA